MLGRLLMLCKGHHSSRVADLHQSRIYYGEFDGTVVVLMLGGLKGDQKSDIKIAGKLYRQLKETHDAERAKKAAMKDDGKTKPKRK